MNEITDPDKVHRFATTSEALPFLRAFSESAKRSIDIFTHTLPPALFDDEVWAENASSLIRRDRKSKLRIIARETRLLYGRDSPLLSLIYRLPSSASIKRYIDGARDPNYGFVCFDQAHLIYFASEPQIHGFARFAARAESRNVLEEFNTLWTYGSKDDPNLKQLTI